MTDLNRNRRQIPRHLRIQGILAGVCGFLLILTLVVPDWIEAVFGVCLLYTSPSPRDS